MKQWLIVIPARLESSRLPNKPLQDLGGKPLIVRVYENLTPLLKLNAKIVVATDSSDIVKACQKENIDCLLTSKDHPSGTDRCNEVAQNFDRPYTLNVQGDEPFVSTDDLITLTKYVEKNHLKMATMIHKSTCQDAFNNPNIVKVAVSQKKSALYFSRSPIPNRSRLGSSDSSFHFWQHVGIYAYQTATLNTLCTLNPSPLEQLEHLEQLRALENNIGIGVIESLNPSIGIDTPEDLEVARAKF